MMKTTIGLGVALILSGPAVAARVSRDTFGCKAIASAEQLATLQASDQTAYADSLGRLTRAGQCRVWSLGEQVAIKDREDGLVCLIPQETVSFCYWSPLIAID